MTHFHILQKDNHTYSKQILACIEKIFPFTIQKIKEP